MLINIIVMIRVTEYLALASISPSALDLGPSQSHKLDLFEAWSLFLSLNASSLLSVSAEKASLLRHPQSFTHSFLYSFKTYLLSTCHVSSPLPNASDTELKKEKKKIPALKVLMFRVDHRPLSFPSWRGGPSYPGEMVP
jgi:hypothetical protein